MAVGTQVRDVHINAPLTNFSQAYRPKGMIAEECFALVPVVHESDIYYTWNKDDAARTVGNFTGTGSLRADGAPAKTVDFGFGKATYYAEEYALNTRITDRQRKNADSMLRLEMNKTMKVQDLLMLDQEYRCMTLYTTVANWAAANAITKVGTAQWSDPSFTGSIESDIDTGREAVRLGSLGAADPNQIIIPARVAKTVKRDSKIRDLVKYTHDTLLVDGDLPPQIWGMKILIPRVARTSSAEGVAGTYSDVWGTDVVMHYKEDNPGLESLTSGVIFRSRPYQVKQWRDERVDSDFFQPSVIQTEVLTSNVAGYLIKSATT